MTEKHRAAQNNAFVKCSLRPGRLQAFCRYPANSHPAKKKRGCEDALRRWRRAKMLPRQEEERSTRCRVLRFVATRLRPTSRSAFLILSLFSGKVFDRPTCSGPEPLLYTSALLRPSYLILVACIFSLKKKAKKRGWARAGPELREKIGNGG